MRLSAWTCRIAAALPGGVLSLLAIGLPAQAADGDCTGYGALSDNPALTLGHIGAGPARTFFVRNTSDRATCPNLSAACRQRSYVVAGDRVIVGRSRGALVCVDYLNRAGEDRAGWLPAAAVIEDPAKPVAVRDWVGRWAQTEASVVLKAAGKPGVLAIHGDATFGATDPDRVKRGAVNVGEIAGEVAPAGAALSFAMGSKGTEPVATGDPDNCRVWMRRLGPYLLVDDNRQCGGINVSFAGVYTRGR